MVLHTDEPHPHVHMVVKAVSEHGVRLNIRRATLRAWRREFARQLRSVGAEANATERAPRGEGRSPKLDGIYRAEMRGDSWHTCERAEAVAADLLEGNLRAEAGKAKLRETRRGGTGLVASQRHPGIPRPTGARRTGKAVFRPDAATSDGSRIDC
jgi:hypothetical protein